MRTDSRTGTGGTGSRRTKVVRRGLAAALLLALAPAARAAAQVPVVQPVTNRAEASFGAGGEGVVGHTEASVTVHVSTTAGVALAPPREAAIHPGGRRVLAHTLTNTGGAWDRFALRAAAPAGWTVSLYLDADGDGALDDGEPRIDAPVAVDAGASIALLLAADAPAGAAEGTVEVSLSAASQLADAARASLVDRLTVRVPAAALAVAKTVDRAAATRGDTLAYAIEFSNGGDAPSPALVLADTLPAGLRLVPGTLRVNGAALTDAADGDAATAALLGDGRGLVRLEVGELASGAAGTLSFRAVVSPEAPNGAGLANVAVLSGPGVSLPTAPAATRLESPELALSKTRVGGDRAGFGEAVAFRIRVSNLSATLVARGVVITDTLPAGLVPASGGAGAEIEGQVVRWRLGDLAPGAAVEVEVSARVSAAAADAPVINRAVASGSNAEAVAASSLPLVVERGREGVLEISKSVAVLEAGLGEAVPYAVTLRNRGLGPISGIVVTDRIPGGTRLDAGGVVGADSVAVDGQTVRFFVAGPLAAASEHTLRYSLVMVTAQRGSGRLANRAWASGAGGLVASDTAEAWVRVRRASAMESRTLLGKVWMDRDGDGRQGPGEPGLVNVEVWSADGEVVTTDAEGRFSFRDLRRGGHVLRVDTLTLPAGAGLPDGVDPAIRVLADGWTTPTLSIRVVARAGEPAPTAGGGGMAAPSLTDPIIAPPTVAPARTAAERADEEARAAVNGPSVRITHPADGVVLPGNRVNVRLQGEPGAQARLYAGQRVVGQGVLRPDGSLDFVAVEVAPGPGMLRASMRGTWGRERWDSVAVHRSGAAVRLEAVTERVTLRAESRRDTPVLVRVLDEWGVPVSNRPMVTAEASLATLSGADGDAASQGWQARTRADGVLEVSLRPGATVGGGELLVSVADAELRVPVTVLPSTRPLIATGAVQVGVGAAPESYGAMTVRGAVGAQTSVSVTYDSRRADPQTEFFGRGYDPNEDTRYPTVGDGSARRTLGGGTQTLNARVEHGLDWVELGDIQTGAFSGSERLGGYGRALTGAMARVGTGAVVLRAFGSMTDQSLAQDQLRADGGTGPFRFGGGVRAGTERVAIEVRDRDNAARVIRRDELARFFDYQIDYRTGEVMLSRAVPSEDGYGNPVFVVATMERRSGDDAHFVGGVRVEGDAARLLPRLGADSLGVALFGVRDGATASSPLAGASDLLGMEMRVRRGGLRLGAEVLRAAAGDSASLAGQANLRWAARGGRLAFTADWLRVGGGFGVEMNPRLRSGLEEIRLGGEMRVGEHGRLRLRHERQNFRAFGVERHNTTLSTEQRVAGRRATAEAGVLSDAMGTGGSSSMALGRATMALGARTDAWLEGSRQLTTRADGTGRPDQVGMGVGYQLARGLKAEGTWRWGRMHRDSAGYQTAGLNLKTELGLGARAWGGVERTEGGQTQHSAVLGWNQRVTLAGGWTLNGQLERRFGLERAPLSDPVRALPFARPEREQWGGAIGVDMLPSKGPRLSYRGEFHDGEQRTGWRFDLGGDVAFGRNGALLTRHDWWEDVRKNVGGTGGDLSRGERSMVGMAVRPAGNDAWNVLAKLEWRYSQNPLAGMVLAGARSEQRLIAATDAVWTPFRGFSLAGRYALRRTFARDSVPELGTQSSMAHFVGGRVERGVYAGLRGRLDARLLAEGVTGTRRWSLAPSLTMGVGGGLELEGGYRFGTLEDADFARGGQSGLFATLGLRFTEGSLASAADFWRQRLRNDP